MLWGHESYRQESDEVDMMVDFANIGIPLAVILVAILFDMLLGDPPNRFHPVAWMGNWIALGRRAAPRTGRFVPFLYGLLLIAGSILVMSCIGYLLQVGCQKLPLVMNVVVQAAILKCAFSARSLSNAANRVFAALKVGNVVLGRQEVSYHLVSRDTSQLNEAQLAAATIESVAENSSDSVVAPLLFYSLAGLPGALVYRFVNTSDAMLGYRTRELEWLGKPAARLDDVLNWIPARFTAILILVSALFFKSMRRRTVASGFRVWWRDHSKTASPNAGHPMSAAAGVLGVELEKVGHYRLGEGQPLPSCNSIHESIQLLWAVTWLSLLPCVCVLVWVAWWR
jgi:adenosylcobinamide-phosphate synthase